VRSEILQVRLFVQLDRLGERLHPLAVMMTPLQSRGVGFQLDGMVLVLLPKPIL
jgi:hypothetical protein